MTSTIDRSFTGTLDVEDQAVSATIRFVGDGVSLLVGGDAVGTWDRDDISFVSDGSSYELRAEGDSIRFDPDDVPAFESFLAGSRSEEPERPAQQDGEPVSPYGVGFTPPPTPAPVEHQASLGFDTPPEPDPEVMPSQKTLFSDDAVDAPVSDLSPSFDVEQDDPEPAISWDAVPDELYAAGLSGGNGDSGPPPFRSAIAPQPGVEADPSEGPVGADEGDRLGVTATETPVEPEPQAAPAPSVPAAHELSEEATPTPAPAPEPPAMAPGASVIEDEADQPGSTPAVPEPDLPDPVFAETEDALVPHAPAPAAGAEPDLLHDSGPAAESGSPDGAVSAAGGRLAGRGTAIAGLARNMIDAFRDRSTTDGTESTIDRTESSEEREEGDITPEPIDDRENLRQWGLVVAGGLVLLALIAMVTWGLTSMLGGDEPLQAAAETTPTTAATTEATVATTTPTTTPPLTTISPENQAAAAGFVESWNRLATQYAYHLSISADSLPISVAPAPTVHLTYDESGVLGLKMAPKGTGSDRDLLLAMGLAVAWGDPTLSPEGRKEVLGAMGVDVDDPQLEEMGGSLSRNGVSYDAAVSDGLIEFRVAPEA